MNNHIKYAIERNKKNPNLAKEQREKTLGEMKKAKALAKKKAEKKDENKKK